MEGRWAQLTVDAHIAHAIDYTKPIKPFVETAVLNAMERQRMLTAYKILDGVGSGEAVAELRINILDMLFGWDTKEKEQEEPQKAVITTNKVNLLNKLKNGSIS